jgi:hypothetical protein
VFLPVKAALERDPCNTRVRARALPVVVKGTAFPLDMQVPQTDPQHHTFSRNLPFDE